MKKRIKNIVLTLTVFISFLLFAGCEAGFSACYYLNNYDLDSWVNVEIVKTEVFNAKVEGVEYVDIRDFENLQNKNSSIVINDEESWQTFCEGKEFFESKKQYYDKDYFKNKAIVIITFLDNADYDYEFELKEMYGGEQGGRWVEGTIFKNVKEKDYDYSDHYVVLFAEVEESNFTEIKNLSFAFKDCFEWNKVAGKYKVGAISIDNLVYKKEWESVENFATKIESVDQLQELVGNNENANNFFTEYLTSETYFNERALLLLHFIDSEIGEYSVEIYSRNNLSVTRNMKEPRQSLGFDQKIIIAIECEKAYIPKGDGRLYDNYTAGEKIAEIFTISELFEQGEFSRQDLIDIAWNTNNAKNNPAVFANLPEEDGRHLNFCKINEFKKICDAGYLEYLYQKNLHANTTLSNVNYYGYYNGYFLFSYHCNREYEIEKENEFTIDGINFHFRAYGEIYALKDCVLQGENLGVTLTREDQNDLNSQKTVIVTFISDREELQAFCDANGLKGLSSQDLEKLDEEFFANNLILICSEDLEGVHSFGGTAYVYCKNVGSDKETICKLYAFSKEDIESFEEVIVEEI